MQSLPLSCTVVEQLCWLLLRWFSNTSACFLYWLVLCQMVPFAEVVLITAMEYHRDDKHGELGNMLMPLNILKEEDDSEEKRYQRCRIPKLKTFGDISWIICMNIVKIYSLIDYDLNTFKNICSFREKSVTHHGIGQLRRLFCFGCNLLLWLLMCQILELKSKCWFAHTPFAYYILPILWL